VAEEYYDPSADPDFVGDGLPSASDDLLRGDLTPRRHPDPPGHPPAADPG
jgi:hypothetical protein